MTAHLAVLYEDDSLLAINKPPGIPSLPDGYNPAAPHLKVILEPKFGSLWILHRLDRDTSGVILLARSAEIHRAVNTLFEKRQVSKTYHAIVQGSPAWQEKVIRLPLRVNGDRRHRTVIDTQRGKPASSHFAILERLGKYTLLKALPLTGRTHQIRAHLTSLNLPILGDALYGGEPALYPSMLKPGFSCGNKAECALIQRSALHAYSLKFMHPKTDQMISLEAPYPKDFNAALRMLRRYPS